MITCGHCNKNIEWSNGMKDHIRDKHDGCKYYAMGPDFRYYSFDWLVERDWADESDRMPPLKKEQGL